MPENRWVETDSYSDGMCGWIEYENKHTTQLVRYHWSVTSSRAYSPEAARDAAERDIANGTIGRDR